MRISDWSSDVCSSDLCSHARAWAVPIISQHAHDRIADLAQHRIAVVACYVHFIQGKQCGGFLGDRAGAKMGDQFAHTGSTKTMIRSEERRVGKECHRTVCSRWSPYH